MFITDMCFRGRGRETQGERHRERDTGREKQGEIERGTEVRERDTGRENQGERETEGQR